MARESLMELSDCFIFSRYPFEDAMSHQNYLNFALFTPLLLVVGCASAPLPVQRLASSEGAIRSASELGAAQTPSAALYLKLAQDNVAQAQRLIKDGDNQRADYVLMRAEADAELALALTRETSTRTAAEQVVEQVKSVKQPSR